MSDRNAVAAPPASAATPAADPRPSRRSRHGDTREDREAAIVDAGLDLFLEKGFASAKVDEVAKRAGVAKGTVYLYFPSKDDLFHAVVRRSIEPLIDVVEDLAHAPDAPAADVLAHVFKALYAEVVATERREVLRLIISEGARFPKLAAHYHTAVVRRGGAALRTLVGDAVARGEFRDGPATRRPEVLMGPALLALVWTLVFHDIDPLDLDDVLAAHIDLVLNGVKSSG